MVNHYATERHLAFIDRFTDLQLKIGKIEINLPTK